MAVEIPVQLHEVAQQVNDGHGRTETVRTLLSWFGAERRGYWKVREIRKALNRIKLKTEPDFEDEWIDGSITFVPKLKQGTAEIVVGTETTAEEMPPKASEVLRPMPVPRKATEDPTMRIGRLAAANRSPLCVAPDDPVIRAITLMLQHDYSQLPVTTTERELKGMFSWKALGSRLALGKKCDTVRECMETAYEIGAESSLFEAIQQIAAHECVLVRDGTRRITGIVTTADLSVQFAQLGEPFLLLGQIENHVRSLISDKYNGTELASARDPADLGREIEDVADLTLGEYIRLLENPERWDKLEIRIDRKTFIDELGKVGIIRNDVMHFDPDGVDPEDLETLRKFARFLRALKKKLV